MSGPRMTSCERTGAGFMRAALIKATHLDFDLGLINGRRYRSLLPIHKSHVIFSEDAELDTLLDSNGDTSDDGI